MANVYANQTYLTMRRSKLDQKVPYKTSMPFGKLVPIGGTPLDILPGDTAKLDLANITRMLTPVVPIMDGISMDVYSFYCPWRILFSKTKNFFGENDQVAWTLVENVNLPSITLDFGSSFTGVVATSQSDWDNPSKKYVYLFLQDSSGNYQLKESIFKGSLFDYMGLPFVYPNYDVASQMQNRYAAATPITELITIQAMPFRGIQAIYNEFFRNENVTDPVLDLVYDDNDVTLDVYRFWKMYMDKADYGLTYRFWYLPSVARWKDLFTSCLPAPQRGSSVSLPLSSGTAPIIAYGSSLNPFDKNNDGTKILFGLGSTLTSASNLYRHAGFKGVPLSGQTAYDRANFIAGKASTNTGDFSNEDMVTSSNLYADLSAVSMATINQIRYAFATQRYYEKLARSGSRYHEYLKVMFGVRPSDAVLQRPQFLGGHHQLLNVQQVLQTSQTDNTPLGSTGAYSLTGFKSHTFTNSFEEFGLVLNFACIRKEHTYCQGLDRYWTKREVWDVYNPTFAHIGEVPVAKNEVYWQPGNTQTFGYNEAWYEYRSTSAKVCGLLSPLAPENLSSFVLTDVYASAPTLSDNFIFEDSQGLDRALVASSTYTDQFICDFMFNYTLSRVIPVRSYPGLIDHF